MDSTNFVHGELISNNYLVKSWILGLKIHLESKMGAQTIFGGTIANFMSRTCQVSKSRFRMQFTSFESIDYVVSGICAHLLTLM